MASKIIISLVLGCALLGGYASMFSSYRYGYLDALRVCTSNATLPGDGPCALDMSDSLTRSITGFPPVDDLINVLLEFFSQGLRRAPGVQGIDLEAFLAFAYLATQFGGAWYIIALEGLRRGNKGTILSWTGTFGITFQAVTITIIAPIYLALQLLGSPSTVPDPEALLVDPHELNLLPLSAVVTYLVPSAGLCLPLIRQIPGETKLLAVALWQPFPLYHSAVQGLGKLLRGSGGGSDARKASTSTSVATYRKALSRANSFITALTVSVHVAVVGIMVASVTSDLVSPVSAHHVLALTSLTEPPMTAMQSPPVSLLDSREVVVSFLRWDVYCTCASLLIWSAYQLYAIRRGTFGIVFKGLFYLLVGGPIFPSLMLLWERDETALRTLEHARQAQKAGGLSQQRGANGSTSKGKRRT